MGVGKDEIKLNKFIQIMSRIRESDEKPMNRREMIKEIGCSKDTFYRWLKDEKIMKTVNETRNGFIRAELSEVLHALLEQGKAGNVAAIKLILEYIQEYAEKSDVSGQINIKIEVDD